MTTSSEPETPLILVVDSDPSRPADSLQVLEQVGFRTSTTRTGLSCMEALRATSPQAIVLGAELVTSDAIELCRALRAVPEAQGLPILMWLATIDDTVVAAAREAGVTEFLADGLGPALVEHRLRAALAHAWQGGGDPSAAEMGTAGEGPRSDRVLTSRDAFLDRLGVVLPRAQAEAKQVAVLAVELTNSGFKLAEGRQGAFCDVILEKLRRGLEEIEEDELTDGFKGVVRIAPLAWNQYAVLVPELERVQDASKLASKLHEVVIGPVEFDDARVVFEANIGIAIYPSDAVGAVGLLERAQTACYYASQDSASNQWFYTDSMNRWAFERLTLEQNLREALDKNELTVYYQPRIDVASRTVVGMEALVRWNHPTLGIVSPAQFIPLAEESGLIVPIGEWVLREACRQNKEWQDAGLPPVRVSVNLSAVQFRRSGLFETVARAVKDTGLDTRWLELELTESMLMRDPQATIETLHQLKGAGIHLSIDDFGTGYSSLSYLKRFPIDALKIDRSFVSDITTNPDDAAIATTIILMAHSLRLEVVAEGV
ncbi:MAG: putative signal transduction protein with EAL and GGDEF domain/CheY-like chemotaxis protein, partial [Gammaproteobacteria bacterium]